MGEGCLQASVLGPVVVWLILLHESSRTNSGDKVHVLAYIDDLVILVGESSRAALEKKLNEIILMIDLKEWLGKAKLE